MIILKSFGNLFHSDSLMVVKISEDISASSFAVDIHVKSGGFPHEVASYLMGIMRLIHKIYTLHLLLFLSEII